MFFLQSQVFAERTFQDAWALLRRHQLQVQVEKRQKQEGHQFSSNESYTDAQWQEVESEVLERLRDSYRFHWNLPFTR